MLKKTLLVSVGLLSLLGLNLQAYDYNSIKDTMLSSQDENVYQNTRNIMPTTVNTIASTSSGISSGQLTSQKSGSGRMFGGASSTSNIRINTVQIAAASQPNGGNITPENPVAAACGSENFDDVVKSTYGTVSLTKNYTDSLGKSCVLGKRVKWCKVVLTITKQFSWSTCSGGGTSAQYYLDGYNYGYAFRFGLSSSGSQCIAIWTNVHDGSVSCSGTSGSLIYYK